MAVFYQVYTICQNGHRNRPHHSPIEGAKMILQGWNRPCRQCGKPSVASARTLARPIFERAREELNRAAESE